MLAPTKEKPETGVSGDGERLIKLWLYSLERVRSAESELNSAECNKHNSETDLARWLLPDDAKVGEKIAIWFGDSLIQVECTQGGPGLLNGKVSIRQNGKTVTEAALR